MWIRGTYRACELIHLGVPETYVIIVEIFLLTIFIGSFFFLRSDGKFNSKVSFGLFLYTLFPTMDSLTDLAYLLSESFYNWNILIIAVTCFIAPNFVFCQILHRKNIQPFLYTHFWRIKIPTMLKFEEVDNIFKFVYTLVLYVLFLLPNLVLNTPTFVFSIVWFCFGLLLFATKAFAVCKVANFWVRYWTWDESHDRYFEGKIVVDILNESIYTEILYETLPQIILQVINNMLVEQWTLISIISTTISGIDMINGVYRFIFYKVYRKINLVDIPVKLEFGGVTLIDEEAFRENEERYKKKTCEGGDDDRYESYV